MEAGVWLSPVPVPRLAPPVATLYQVTVPVAQVAAKETVFPSQIFIEFTATLVGIVVCAATVT